MCDTTTKEPQRAMDEQAELARITDNNAALAIAAQQRANVRMEGNYTCYDESHL